jgi:hypothetical protein
LWQAALTGGGFSPVGSSVIVRDIEGLELVVDRVEQPATNPAHALAE